MRFFLKSKSHLKINKKIRQLFNFPTKSRFNSKNGISSEIKDELGSVQIENIKMNYKIKEANEH